MTQRFNMDNTEQTSPLIGADEFDKAVGLLALAKRHEVALTVNGDKLRLTRATKVDPLVVDMLTRNKADLMDIMNKPDAIKLWLDDRQARLADIHSSLNEAMDRWDLVEGIYHDLFPVDRECVCSRGYCIDTAIITCNACVKNKEKGA